MDERSEKPEQAYRLEVDAAPGAGELLMRIELGEDAPAPGPGLPWLGGDFEVEYWHGAGEQLRCFALEAPDDPAADPAGTTERLYARLIETLRASDYAYPLRLWNYFPAINAGLGDDERYRRFCIGRGRALEAAGLADASMCAATAIGGFQPRMRVIALAGRYPGISIENPRQVSAWNYPADYGPRSPAFARATAVHLHAGRVGLLISGTASVVGHATAHAGDVAAQTLEAAANLEALLDSAAAQTRRTELSAFNGRTLARAYVRNPGDWPRVREILARRWPGVRVAGLAGEICRSDLLVEVEAWHCA